MADWEVAVRRRRLDVAVMALPHVEQPECGKALRRSPPDRKVALGAVAVEIGEYEEALQLFQEADRWDLVRSLWEARNKWDMALEVAHTHDRIHLRTAHYHYARHLEALGDVSGAMREYKLAGVQRWEVPRMLFEGEQLETLHRHVDSEGDAGLWEWWARYEESRRDWERAGEYYGKAHNSWSVVRLHCFLGNHSAAKAAAEAAGTPAGWYHWARHAEAQGHVTEAVEGYEAGGCYHHALRLALQHHLSHVIAHLGRQAGGGLGHEAGQYFERRGDIPTAVSLYVSAGSFASALDLSFRAHASQGPTAVQAVTALKELVPALPASLDPSLVSRTEAFCREQGLWEGVVHMLVLRGDFLGALQICLSHKVEVTEELAERLTPGPGVGPREREEVLRRVGKVCKRQGHYHLACKKYTQAKLPRKALKVLLKSGDTEKIIAYANIAKQKDLYVLAANYLQSLDWRSQPHLMKQIVTFYSKARAPESLSLFYEACAQVEMEDYNDYGKAVGALKESLKYALKGSTRGREELLKGHLHHLDLFLRARLPATDPSEALSVCRTLLDLSGKEAIIPRGDIFTEVVRLQMLLGTPTEAFQTVKLMHSQGLGKFLGSLPPGLLEEVYAKNGQQLEKLQPDEEEIVEEEDEVKPSKGRRR